MFSTIVVGMDGQQGGSDAMVLARRLAGPDTEIVAVAVAVADTYPSRTANLEFDRQARVDAELLLAAVREQEPPVEGEAIVAHSVGAGLHAVAERRHADLIVVGSCRRGAVGRILAGDDTHGTLRDAPCPVAVGPRDYAFTTHPVVTIGVGWDGEPEADRALGLARQVAQGVHGDVHVLAVVDVPNWPLVDPHHREEDLADELDRVNESIASLDGIAATAVTGVAADELVRFSDEVDLLVVGSRQRGALSRIALGSTSEQLTRRSVRPLLVVPRVPVPAVSHA